MKKQLLFKIIVFLLITLDVFAQYPDNIFKDYTPKWLHCVYDSTAIPPMDPDKYNGMLYRNSVFQDSFIYSLYEYEFRIGHHYPIGGYLEKININTGDRAWATVYDLRTIDKNERPNKVLFNKDNKLEILGFRKRIREDDPYDVDDPLFKFVRRQYNPDDGKLISITHEKDGDSMGYLMYGLNDRGRFYPYEENIYQYTINQTSLEDNNLTAVILDTLGIAIDTMTYYVKNKYPIHRITPLRRLSKDTLVTIFSENNFYHQLDDSFDVEFHIILMDQDFNHIDSFNITDVLNPKNRFDLKMQYVDNKVIIAGLADEPELFNWRNRFLFFDYNGKLIDSIDISDLIFFTSALTRISKDEFLIYGIPRNGTEDFGNFRFYRKKIGEKKKLLREIKLKEKEKYFFCDEIQIIDNDIILFGNMTHFFLGDHCCEHGYPMTVDFPVSDILDYVNTEDELILDKDNIKIYPNPAQDILKVDFNEHFTGTLEIIDVLDKTWKKYKVHNEQTKNLDISSLKSGIYFIKTISDNKNKVYNVKRFIKD